ncbi:hypothetical protein LXM94_16765 [Rhizobium sp. TRM95111]|uniref:hypothetical protein n=1 Tax=Rhizobium alarense TaxID=2846851 RepID=UPI001F439CE6|nr:hypothetical protein [Rhizobium alarense]MCF3641626.1 hypothetical protein [Rhizobium alarense]
MLAFKVHQFHALRQKLADEIDNYETPEFKALDHMVAETFESIVCHVPQDAAETRALISFLLDVIARNDGHDNLPLIERVRALTDAMLPADTSLPLQGHSAGL